MDELILAIQAKLKRIAYNIIQTAEYLDEVEDKLIEDKPIGTLYHLNTQRED